MCTALIYELAKQELLKKGECLIAPRGKYRLPPQMMALITSGCG